MSRQRYISHELTHFVGRSLRDDSGHSREHEQFALLLEILRSGHLGRYKPPSGPRVVFALQGDGSKNISSNEKYTAEMVCFCDIPVVDLALHMHKYSRFGLAFSKRFLADKGASPVFYVSQTTSIPGSSFLLSDRDTFRPFITLKDAFDAYDSDWRRLHEALHLKGMNALCHRLRDCVLPIGIKADVLIHAQMKFFDVGLEESHDYNFYMEREWRVWGTVPFELDDVTRVVLPASFAKRFREQIPAYSGQISFSEPPEA